MSTITLAPEHYIPPNIRSMALQHSSSLGRILRHDPPEFQGQASEWFTRSAFIDGDLTQAAEYALYQREEYRRLDRTVVGGWLADVIGYVQDAPWSGEHAALLLHMNRTQLTSRLDRLAELAFADLLKAIESNNALAFDISQESMRELHIISNDLTVRLIQDLLTAVKLAEGDEAVVEVLDISYQHIWRGRYEAWFTMSDLERLALSVEGIRGHYGGPDRHGDCVVMDMPDYFEVSFDPCGTGQVMRRGDSERESGPYIPLDAVGVASEAAAWNQDTPGMPLYCTHCPVLLEYFPMRDFDTILRPVLFNLDPTVPCRWRIPKGELRPDEHSISAR